MTTTQILRRPQVEAVTSMSRSTIYKQIQEGTFPRPVKLGGVNSRSVGWRSSDIQQWLDERAQAAGLPVDTNAA